MEELSEKVRKKLIKHERRKVRFVNTDLSLCGTNRYYVLQSTVV